MKTVIILRGVSGCGKTTLAKHLMSQMDNCKIVSADYYLLDEHGNFKYSRERLAAGKRLCLQTFEEYLTQSVETIIVDNTNVSPEHFEEYRRLATLYDYQIFTIVLENRAGFKDVHNIPFEAKEWQKINLRNNIVLQ